jgi:hypothetical protein
MAWVWCLLLLAYSSNHLTSEYSRMNVLVWACSHFRLALFFFAPCIGLFVAWILVWMMLSVRELIVRAGVTHGR